MDKTLQQVLDSLKGTDQADWCVAAASVLAHICIRNSVTREEFMEICQRSFDGADKMLSMFKPCSQAHVGLTVYASDAFTISSDSADGPPAGKLIEFSPRRRRLSELRGHL
jgi:hypothetical protein